MCAKSQQILGEVNSLQFRKIQSFLHHQIHDLKPGFKADFIWHISNNMKKI